MKRVKILRDKLIEFYVDKRLTQFEIAKIYNVDRTTIGNRLKEFQIPVNNDNRKYLLLKQIPLSREQKDFLVGTILGDGSIVLPNKRKNARFQVGHCEKQKEYLFWKKSIMGNLVNNIRRLEDKRGNSVMYTFNTLSHKELNFYRKLFYENNKKIVREEAGLHLNPLGLATWFMDDGSKSGKCSYRLSTEGFSEEENHILKNILKSNFDLNVKVCGYTRRDKSYFYLFLNKRNTINMTDIIKDYVIDCMRYKLVDCSPTIACQTSGINKKSFKPLIQAKPLDWRQEWRLLRHKINSRKMIRSDLHRNMQS